MTDILVVNNSQLLTVADIAPAIAAINQQIVRDFTPAWGVAGLVHFGDTPAGAWQFSLQDTIDQKNDLGYHVDENGIVSAIIDVGACKAYNDDWRTCLGHEVLEALADPLCTRMAPNGIDLVEVCDPVELDSYTIDSVPVTNFVLPSYFGFNNSAPYDHLGRLGGPAPLLLPGGYSMRLVSGQWETKFGEEAKGYMAMRQNGRRAWRMRNAS